MSDYKNLVYENNSFEHFGSNELILVRFSNLNTIYVTSAAMPLTRSGAAMRMMTFR